jgi:hypothetical protein
MEHRTRAGKQMIPTNRSLETMGNRGPEHRLPLFPDDRVLDAILAKSDLSPGRKK